MPSSTLWKLQWHRNKFKATTRVLYFITSQWGRDYVGNTWSFKQWWISWELSRGKDRRLYSHVLWCASTLCKSPFFQWIYGKPSQIYEKLRSDQMDPKSALGRPKQIARNGRSLLKNWSYTSNQCIYFIMLLYWRPHVAKTLFILHKYIKCALI